MLKLKELMSGTYVMVIKNLSLYVIIKIIISLFQEDNIFGMNASLTYGPRLQR